MEKAHAIQMIKKILADDLNELLLEIREIKNDAAMALKMIDQLEIGGLYLYDNDSYIIEVCSFTAGYVQVRLVAAAEVLPPNTSWMMTYYTTGAEYHTTYDLKRMVKVKPIALDELPCYMNFKFKTALFDQILKSI